MYLLCLYQYVQVARLAALSFGEEGLSMERWKYVLSLEEQLDARTPK